MILTPLLVLAPLGGSTFLSHGHDEHGAHLHAAGLLHGGMLALADHAKDHGHEHSMPPKLASDGEQESGSEQGEVPEGTIVSLAQPKQLPQRSLDLAQALCPSALMAIAIMVMPAAPHLERQAGSPGGLLDGEPSNLRPLTAGERLVRTSRALLI